jgi:PAS domain-containing protein
MLTGGDDMESAPASGDAHPLRVVALIYLCGALLFGTLLALEWRLIDRTVAAIARERGAAVEGAEEGRGPVHRYMAPLVVREPCLQCHAEQGYVLGDIRGGISVTMPAGVLIARRDQLRTRAVFIYVLAGLLAAGLVHGLLRANRRHVVQVRFINAEQERLIERRTGELAEANRRLAGEVELHRRSEQRLAASESRYRAIFDSAAEGIMLLDAALRIVQVNPAFSEITGYAAEEVLGRTPSMLGSGRHDGPSSASSSPRSPPPGAGRARSGTGARTATCTCSGCRRCGSARPTRPRASSPR